MIEDAMENFWKSSSMKKETPKEGIIGPVDRASEYLREAGESKKVPLRRPSMYNKTKVEKMYGPSGGVAEIYANGKMYIVFPDGGYQTRNYPSRPEAIRDMLKKGWVLE